MVNLFQKVKKEYFDLLEDQTSGLERSSPLKPKERKKFETDYKKMFFNSLVPGKLTYISLKSNLKNPNYTSMQKISNCAIDLTLGLGLEASRFSSFYLIYRAWEIM